MNQPVRYEENALVISIPTNCPAHLHGQLLSGITAVLKQQLIHPAENTKEREAMVSLAELQACLLPTEAQLEKVLNS